MCSSVLHLHPESRIWFPSCTSSHLMQFITSSVWLAVFFSMCAVADLGGYTWGVSSSGPSLCPTITSDLNGGCMGSASDLPLGFLPPSTMAQDYIAQSRQVAAASPANYDITRLGPLGLFQAHTGLDLPAICADLEGYRQDEYVEFTAADDACPKVNISQLPLRYGSLLVRLGSSLKWILVLLLHQSLRFQLTEWNDWQVCGRFFVCRSPRIWTVSFESPLWKYCLPQWISRTSFLKIWDSVIFLFCIFLWKGRSY